MYCMNCGQKNIEGAKFCGKCGAPLFPEESDAAPPEPEGPEPGKKNWWKILLVILICAAAVVVVFFVLRGRTEHQYGDSLEAGRAYMQEEAYEEAVAEFTDAIGVDPKAVEPYLLLAETYGYLGDEEMAEEIYDEARDMILDTYAEANELPEGAEDLYLGAISRAASNGSTGRVDELQNEVTGMLPDDETDDFTERLNGLLESIKSEENGGKTDSVRDEENKDGSARDEEDKNDSVRDEEDKGGSARDDENKDDSDKGNEDKGGSARDEEDKGGSARGNADKDDKDEGEEDIDNSEENEEDNEDGKGQAVAALSLNEQSVSELLSTIADAAGLSEEWHTVELSDGNGDLTEQEKVDYGLAYELAALSLWNSDAVEYGTWYYEVDGDMISYDSLSDAQSQNVSAVTYYRLSPERYEETLNDLFGSEYDPEKYDAANDGVGFVKTDGDGNFYIMGAEYFEDAWTEVSLESLSEEADRDGTFEAVAKHTIHRVDGSDDDFYMEYRLVPDEDSGYGCIITEMTRLESEPDAAAEPAQETVAETATEEMETTEGKDSDISLYQTAIDQYAQDSLQAYSFVLYDIDTNGREELVVQGEDTIQIYALNGEEPVAMIDEEMLEGYDAYDIHVYENGAIWLACYMGGDSYVMKGVFCEIGEDGCTLEQTAAFWDTVEEPDQTYVEQDGEETEVLDGAPRDIKGLMTELREEQADGTDEIELAWTEIVPDPSLAAESGGAEWQQLYADSLTANPPEYGADTYFYLVYINDDEIPELFCTAINENRGFSMDSIYYIRDSEVHVLETTNTQFAERGGYIFDKYTDGGSMNATVMRLTDENELITESEFFEGIDGSGNYACKVDGREVDETEFGLYYDQALEWMYTEEHNIIYSAGSTLRGDYGNFYADPFAHGVSEAIEKLGSGDF